MNTSFLAKITIAMLTIALPIIVNAQANPPLLSDSAFVRENYTKTEVQIPMRDGTKLFTAIYTPKDAGAKNTYPMMLQRTCYSVAPYGANEYKKLVGPSSAAMREKYIVVYQDVRGRWMSEGTFTNMTPHIADKKVKSGKNADVDEASDTFDTIEWLIKNVAHHNGRVGQWGISYPGFYTIAGALCRHPALKASSPQAPIADFFFDDFHHNGAMVLGYFSVFPLFGVQHAAPTSKQWYEFVKPPTKDGYQFMLDAGPLSTLTERYYKDNFFWKEHFDHPNYDEFWQKRNLLPHLTNVKHAIMTVGGWFDAEDLYGPLNIYKTLEKNNPGSYNTIVMGPFGHGDWARNNDVHTMHNHIYFGDSISAFYQHSIEAPFFKHFLKGAGDGKTGLPEAYMFDTGKKLWRTFAEYPVKAAQKRTLYFHAGGKLSFTAPSGASDSAMSDFISDPAKPVPHTEDRTTTQWIPRPYMSEDQRFASSRPDVLVFQTDTLTEDITLGGELLAMLNTSTSGTDADWIVKLIDVYPGWTENHPYLPHKNITLSGYQQMVRSEIMRSRFRKSFSTPEALKPNEVTPLNFRLQDCLHTFKKGHRIMIHVQSTCFPLFDRNPQTFVENIYKAEAKDYVRQTHRVYHGGKYLSGLQVDVLE